MDGRRPRQWNDYRGGSIAASTGSDDVSRIRVNGALKMLDHGDGCIIAKREYLHHDYRARFPGRVNPEKGVVDTSPRQGAAGTTAFDGLGVDSKSQAKLVQRRMREGSLANWGTELLSSTSIKSPIWLRLIWSTVAD